MTDEPKTEEKKPSIFSGYRSKERTTDEPKSIDYKGRKVFTICGCKATIVNTPDGKRHLEGDCISKAARDELAAILEEEMILRVNPKVTLEETPEEAPVT